MDLYLIRHGETVDNVAGLYAGVRDSKLTNHGVEQARRLGQHFVEEPEEVIFDRIFASPLSRAFKTAQAIQTAQKASRTKRHSTDENVEIVCVPELIEQDFGFYEGKSFQSRTDPRKSGKEAHREKHKDEPGFVDVESKDSLNQRADKFLEEHLLPLFSPEHKPGCSAIAVVSHGILLSHLWRRLLLRLPPKSVTVAPDIIASKGSIILQHLGGWSNTGYLQLSLSRVEQDPVATRTSPVPITKLTNDAPLDPLEVEKEVLVASTSAKDPAVATSSILNEWTALIVAIDKKDHLAGLKRQRGGIGRSAHDEGQQKLTGFFKRQRTS